MSENEKNSERGLGDQILKMNREELCAFVGRLCLTVQADVGAGTYHGGLYPENIHLEQDGSIRIGPGRLEKWKGQEIDFVAPELYWDGSASPAADVYSLGLILWYGLSGGKLPFEGESPNAQLSRMSGKAIPAPPGAPQRLGEVVEKACSFKPESRYRTPGQLQIMLASCQENQYLSGAPGGQAVFGKQGDQLSDMERLMVDIMEGKEEAPAEPQPAETSRDWERDAFVDDLMKPEETRPKTAGEPKETQAMPRMIPLKERPEPRAEQETLRVYEPARERRIPVLTEEKNPELAPVVPKSDSRVPPAPPASERPAPAQERKSSARRSRPLTVVLALCALLVLGAVVVNAVLHYSEAGRQVIVDDTPAPVQEQPAATPTPAPAPTPQPEASPEPVSSYQVFRQDISWTDAQAACRAMGGHLAVITSQEEFNEIVIMAAEAGISRLWIGCHRDNGSLVYETTEAVLYDKWDTEAGEPSYWDAYDGSPEDYVMIWYRDGAWYYNDSRNDPAADYPQYYSGIIGYVCEFGT